MIIKTSKSLLIGLVLTATLGFDSAFAQKVQNVQENSIWMSAPLKVDGKIQEETFQAMNKSTLLWYTISNDDKNIYLILKSTDSPNSNKIMMGGITLSINTSGKKSEKDAFMITYPVITRPQGGRGQGGGQRMGNIGGQQGGGMGQRSAS